jgi:hypothetical protein
MRFSKSYIRTWRRSINYVKKRSGSNTIHEKVALECLDEIERQAKHIEELTKERDYLDARLAEFEGFSRDFIKLEYDNVLRERLEKILYKESEGE